MPADAAIKVNNSNRNNYAGGYNQVMSFSEQQALANSYLPTTQNLPVAVEDENLADAILNNSSETTMNDLEKCSQTIPGGNFKWGVPESGRLRNSSPRCLVVVDLREANSQKILATTTLAVGDTMNCNIDSFPRSGTIPAVLRGEIELPADNPPTEQDVINIMNEEQKQNAGLKIAAGAIISGVAGNLLSPKAAGDTKTLGLGKTRLINTAIGAASGAGIMAASTYSGKVAGDTIKSVAVNAASGMVVGNMMAGANGGDSTVATVKCSVGDSNFKEEKDCVIGTVMKRGAEITSSNDSFYIVTKSGSIRECKKCGATNCNNENNVICTTSPIKLLDIYLTGDTSQGGQDMSFDNLFKPKDGTTKNTEMAEMIHYQKVDGGKENEFEIKHQEVPSDDTFYKITSAVRGDKKTPAYAVFENGVVPKKMFGYKSWDDLKEAVGNAEIKYYKRNTDGSVGSEYQVTGENQTFEDMYSFSASSRDADDGELVDLSNKSRLKGTLVGSATGGALGGISGFEGAKTEIQDRYLSARQEYEDSLTNFMCSTGSKFLRRYNDTVLVSPNQPDEE